MSEHATKRYYIFPFVLSCLTVLISSLIVWSAFVSNSLWFIIIAFVFLAVCGIFFTFCLVQIFRLRYYLRKCDEKRAADSELKGVIIFSGAPRTGKSADGGQTIISHCLALQAHNQYRYKLLKTIKLYCDLDENEQREFDELKIAWDFYEAHPDLIPFLASNVPLKIGSQMSLPLHGAHFMQDERLPPFCDVFIDESSVQIDTDLHKDRPQDIDEFFRFPCHFLGDKTLIVNCEQDAVKSYIAIRRSMWFNKYELGQEWVMRPIRLLKRFERLKRKFIKSKKANIKLAIKLLKLDDKSRLIGFRRFNFIRAGSTENKYVKPSELQCEYTPSGLDYIYDNRVFRNLYQCKDKSVKYDFFDGLLLSPSFRKEIIRLVREGNQKVVGYKRKK